MAVPRMMKAAVLHGPNDLRVEEVPVPEAGAGEVLLKVGACGICGSDLRYLVGENPWAKHTLGHEFANPPDMILGHEIGGTASVEGELRRGAVLSFKTCGKCRYCRTGMANLCAKMRHLGHGAGWEGQNPGGMAEYCPVWVEHIFELPETVSMAEATFLDALGVAVHAVRQTRIFPCSPVLIVGSGPIGLSIGQVALAQGAEPVVVTDVYEAALECAGELGLGPCINVRDAAGADVVDELRQASGGKGFSAVFETSGQLAAQEQALAVLARGGTLMAMAGVAEGLRLDESSLAGERRLTTCSNNLVEDFEMGRRLLVGGKVRVKPMITHTYRLEDAVEAFSTAMNKQETGAIKVILVP